MPTRAVRIKLLRHKYSDEETIGTLFVDGVFFCYTLEDRVRLVRGADGNVLGKKIPGRTAIPAGTYPIKSTFSMRFDKILVELFEVPQFKYSRLHGGNTAKDTEGCILTAESAQPRYIAGRAIALAKELAVKVSGTEGSTIEIVDDQQADNLGIS